MKTGSRTGYYTSEHKNLRFRAEYDAKRLGIAVIAQEFQPYSQLTCWPKT